MPLIVKIVGIFGLPILLLVSFLAGVMIAQPKTPEQKRVPEVDWALYIQLLRERGKVETTPPPDE